MLLKQTQSFFVGLVLTITIYGSIAAALLYYLLAFPPPSQTLPEAEKLDAFFFYLVLTITMLTALIIFRQIKRKHQYAAFGVGVPFLFAVYICF